VSQYDQQAVRTVYQARIPLLPPSANKMYTKTRFGMVPSKEMKVFLSKATIELMRQLPLDFQKPDQNQPHRLVLNIYVPSLYNAGYPKTTKNLFKRKDASNLIKVVEDLIATTIDVDDSCFVSVVANKYHGPDHGFEGIDARLEVLC